MKKRVNHIKKGDKVKVIAGREKGKTGEVLKVDPGKGRAIVSKVNFIKRHQRPTQQMKNGGIIEKEGSVNASNLQLLCPRCNESSRVGFRKIDGKSVRYCKKCDEVVDKV